MNKKQVCSECKLFENGWCEFHQKPTSDKEACEDGIMKTVTNKQELIKEIVHLYSELDQKGEELAAICEKEIQPLIDAKKYQEAKEHVYSFYKDCVDKDGNSISIEKDMILARLNRLINKNKIKRN